MNKDIRSYYIEIRLAKAKIKFNRFCKKQIKLQRKSEKLNNLIAQLENLPNDRINNNFYYDWKES